MSTQRIYETKGILADRLRDIRRAAGLTGRALADANDWHPSKVSKIEHGTQMPSEQDIHAWCETCDAPQAAPDLAATARYLDSMYVEWRRVHSTGMRVTQETFTRLYRQTHQLRIYQHSTLPGLVQTPAYAHAHLAAINFLNPSPDDLNEAVAERMTQQEVLTDPNKRFMILVGQQALVTRLCEPDDMVTQLEKVADLATLPQMCVGIVPRTARLPVMPPENFWIYDSEQVRIDVATGQFRMRTPTDIALYERLFALLTDLAVYGDNAQALITSAIAAARSE